MAQITFPKIEIEPNDLDRLEGIVERFEKVVALLAPGVIQSLLDHLPDSYHPDNDTWERGWNELDNEAQDAVKSARADAERWISLP